MKVSKSRKKRKSKGSVSKKNKKKASFKHSGGRKGVKGSKKSKKDKKVEAKPDPTVYNIYDLTPLPREAWPQLDKPNRGNHSYTLNFGAAVIEVLLQKEAYFIKKVVEGFPGPCNQVTWGRYGGPVSAWEVVKSRSGFRRE